MGLITLNWSLADVSLIISSNSKSPVVIHDLEVDKDVINKSKTHIYIILIIYIFKSDMTLT